MVSSWSPHNLYLLFCCVLSILALIWLVLIALFCAAIRRNSVSLIKFSFLSHVQVFSCEMLFISRLKRPELFFFPFLFPIYCRSVVHSVVCLVFDGCNQSSSVFFMSPSSRCIDAAMLSSMLESSLPPSFLDTYSLLTSSLGCNALCMVISFLVLWSICLSSLVHFKMGPEYLTRGTAKVFISLIRFLLHSFVLSSFLVFLRYSFLIFPFISTCLVVSASKMPKYL